MNWALNHPDFLEKYNAARNIQAERMIDEILDIADDGSNDYIERMVRGKEVVMLDNEHVQRSKLRVEARLRIAAKLLPKKYGDRPDEHHITTIVNNVMSIARQRELQERRQAALTGRVQDA